MKYETVLSLSALLSVAFASTCQEISGNWYCDETDEVIYTGLGGVPGSYSRVTNMDADSCVCTKATQNFSGPLSPLDEDLSIHFRGPIQIAQFAAYSLDTASTSEKRKRQLNRKRDQVIYTLVPPIFTEYDLQTTSSSQTVSISTSATTATNLAPGDALSTTGTLVGLPSQLSEALSSASTTSSAGPSISSTSTTITSSSVSTPVSTADAVWSRGSYYNAASGILDNAVFLNNMGGILSGTWSSCFGNSLSYASSSGNYTAAEPETLSDVLIPSDTEVIIFSGTACTTETCGYVSDGVPAYLGFGGDNKMFLFEFTMPSEPDDIGSFNGDMPAIWALNAQIPRSQQYGSCSCWPECGELDLFEILSGGSDMLTTTFHSVVGGGGATSNYFERPTTGYMKAAVVFIGSTKQIEIIVLDDDVEFTETLAFDVYEGWQQSSISNVTLVD